MTDYLLLACDFYSVVPVVIYFIGIYIGVYFNIIPEALGFVIFSFLADQSTKFIKALPYPDFMWDITRRPEGAYNTDYFSRNGPTAKDAPGFPSGHMTGITLFCLYMVLRKKGDIPWDDFFKDNKGFVLFNIFTVLAMAFARWYKTCHNLFQIVGGILYGSLISYLYYEYIGKYLIK